MKKFIFTICLLTVFSIFGFTHEYFIEVEDKGPIFIIKMKTYKDYDSMRSLKIANMIIEKPALFEDGIIDLQVVESQDRSLMEIGPQMGSFAFRKGINLPNGYYSLIINDQDYGYLTIWDNGIYFDPINCL